VFPEYAPEGSTTTNTILSSKVYSLHHRSFASALPPPTTRNGRFTALLLRSSQRCYGHALASSLVLIRRLVGLFLQPMLAVETASSCLLPHTSHLCGERDLLRQSSTVLLLPSSSSSSTFIIGSFLQGRHFTSASACIMHRLDTHTDKHTHQHTHTHTHIFRASPLARLGSFYFTLGRKVTRTPTYGAVPGPWIRPWLRLDTARSRVLTSNYVGPLHACAHCTAPWGTSALGLAYTLYRACPAHH
jgi:hypothetical protein